MQSKRSRYIVLGMLLCGCTSAFIRLLALLHIYHLNVTHLSFLCYMMMVMLYIYDVIRRLINKQVKIILVMSGLMLFTWMCIRTIKYQLAPQDVTLLRYLWYAYYFCDLGIATTITQAVLLVYKQTPWWRLFVLDILSIVGSFVVFTNDLHQEVFAFPKGLMHHNIYTYQVGYYLIMAYIATLIVTSIGLIAKEERAHIHKVLYPLAFLLLGVIYCVAYVFGPQDHWFVVVFRPSEMACIIFIGLMEALMVTHLFPTNDHYQSLIRLSSLQIGILDHKGKDYLKSAFPISFDQVKSALSAPLPLENHLRLHALKIRGGYAYFIEDCRALDKQREDLLSLKETLEMKNAMLEENNRLELANKQVIQQAEIYSRMRELTHMQRSQIDRLLEAEPFDESIKQVIIFGAYIKRFSDLYLQASTQKLMNSATLHLCLRESLTAMETYGMITDLSMMNERMVSGQSLVSCYQAFEEIVEAALPNKATLMIHINCKEHLIMDVEVSHSYGIASLPYTKEEGVLYYHWEG